MPLCICFPCCRAGIVCNRGDLVSLVDHFEVVVTARVGSISRLEMSTWEHANLWSLFWLR